MHLRTFLFLLFITTSIIFFLTSLQPELILTLCGSMCYHELSLNYIQLTSMLASIIALILFLISNYFGQKRLLKEKEKVATR